DQPEQTGDAASDNDRGMLEDVSASHSDEHEVESVGAEDALEEIRSRRKPVRRQYKIQEVIKRRQILLVQVVKEERGNKGAALTTYLSLAGRYSVLMPNTARGGGISRKITNAQDRKRLKEVVTDLDVPQGMGVILRTAGESRTKAEIKRDYEYLMRLWENVRSLTLQSTAPALVYEEGSLIKRSVRDLYNKDIDEILVSGEDGYREAKDFMRMLMPSHAKVVQPYRDTTPIFVRNGIEAQLDRMLQPQVTLKSGGYIIINQTEALVSIDVNSGRSTKEHSIEETALHTNLEAAEEVARQLRLRDLAGLIVIDFIDMEENRNNRAVEKRLKDHLKNDRARIQVGRISHFGLMEMSRQRIRASVLESTMKPCPHCGGTGHVRSDSSVALMVVRAIEEFLLKDSRSHIIVRTPAATALYVLNHKRANLVELEARFGLTITIEADETLGTQHYAIFRGAIAEKPEGFVEVRSLPAYVEPDEPEDEIVIEEEEEAAVQAE
ncbi:MAG: ribonuclease E/G, partial [Mesorhizobium sp.]